MVKTLPSSAGSVGSIPDWGAKIQHTLWPKQKNRSNVITNSIKILKMVYIKKNKIILRNVSDVQKKIFFPAFLEQISRSFPSHFLQK